MNKNVVIAFLLFALAQAMIWYQLNAQFLSNWAKERPWLLALIGLPISYILIIATKHVVVGFNGLLWPGRLIGFSTGMLIMAFFTYFHMGEGITLKTALTLLLACMIVSIQLFWK